MNFRQSLGALFRLGILGGSAFAMAAGCGVGAETGHSDLESAAVSGNGVTGSLTLTSDWTQGYCATVTITDTGTTPTTSWQAVLNLNQSTIQSIWSVSSSQSGSTLTATSLSYDAVLSPGGSATFGFCASATGSSYHPTLVSVFGAGASGGGSSASSGHSSASSTSASSGHSTASSSSAGGSGGGTASSSGAIASSSSSSRSSASSTSSGHSSASSTSSSAGSTGSSSSGASHADAGAASSSGSSNGADAGSSSCIGETLLGHLGKSRLLVGVSTDDTTAAEAPFDLRYIYISGGLFDSTTPCTSCGSSCVASGQACTNGCAWWGCYDSPPGSYVGDFLSSCASESPPPTPMFTYYEILQTADATFSNFQEGTAEATQAATNTGLMTRYFNDWRFLLQQIGQKQAFLHIEPDFWGYARQAGAATAAAAVASANPTDCGSLPNTIGGMGQCMIAMVRKYAPNAFVGLHASAWNIASNTYTGLDVTTDAQETASFLAACGQSGADFVVVETSDRDAGYYQFVENEDTWWDPTDTTLPNYKQDLTWIKALTEALGTPALYWQTPLGNASQNNTTNHYQDNRVDYFFGGNAATVESGAPVSVPAHWSELAAAHVVGVAFGAGAGGCTTPATDGNLLINDTKAYVSAGGQPLCP